MLSFSPSQEELKQMIGRDISDINELTYKEKVKLYSDLRSFTHNAMDVYAKNFNRDNVKGKDDLLYFGRIETEREYKHYEKEVINGKAKTGDIKTGLQFHIHVIVSRKSANGKVKLSPNIRFRGAKWERRDTGERVTRGFNYRNFTEQCSKEFTNQFNIETKKNHRKGVLDTGINKIKGKAKGQVYKYTNQVFGEELKTERAALAKINQMSSIVKNITSVAAAGSNPVSASKAVIDLAVKTAKAIHSVSANV